MKLKLTVGLNFEETTNKIDEYMKHCWGKRLFYQHECTEQWLMIKNCFFDSILFP